MFATMLDSSGAALAASSQPAVIEQQDSYKVEKVSIVSNEEHPREGHNVEEENEEGEDDCNQRDGGSTSKFYS